MIEKYDWTLSRRAKATTGTLDRIRQGKGSSVVVLGVSLPTNRQSEGAPLYFVILYVPGRTLGEGPIPLSGLVRFALVWWFRLARGIPKGC